jgi:hypothetical protein
MASTSKGHTGRKPRYQNLLLNNAVGNGGRVTVSARSHFRRSADALVRRGLLILDSANGYIATFEITPDGRVEYDRLREVSRP